ncbi:MAG: glycosyltransferase family 39 protein [Nitrospirota bacterium]
MKERKKILVLLGISLFSVALADGSGHVLKDIFERQRPCNTLENINLLVGCGRSFSMPSNHASNAFAFAMTFWFLRKNMASYILIFFASLVGLSRVYVGVHYPFDVLAGAFLGICSSCASVYLYKWATSIYEKKSYWNALLFCILLISLFRVYYIQTGPFDLSPDEAHYWEWSRRLDWSYYSKGPVIAYLIYAGTSVFGNNVFGIRILAVAFSALSSLILYRLATDLYDEKTGFASALLIQIVPLYSAYGVLLTIDSPFIFFWILSLFLSHKAVTLQMSDTSGRLSGFYWVMLGISAGLGLLTKYTMAFFYISGFLFLLFYKDARKILASKWPYISFIISMIVFSPVIAWNYIQGWVTFKHTAGQAHLSEGLKISLRSFFEFLGSQAGVVTPVLFILILIALWKLRKNLEGSFLFWFAVPTIAFFVLKSLQGKVQANWALTGYATGFIAFSACYIKDIALSKKVMKILTVSGILLAFTVTALAHFPSMLNLSEGKDPTIRLVGWKELGTEAGRIYEEMSLSGPVFIFSDKYQVSSELAFYIKGNPVTYCVNLGRRMNQYDLWPGFEKFTGYNAIYVTTKERNMPEELGKAFGRYEKEVITTGKKQNKKVKFTIFKCYDFRAVEFRSPESF